MARLTLQDYVAMKESQPKVLCHGDVKLQNIIIDDATGKSVQFKYILESHTW